MIRLSRNGLNEEQYLRLTGKAREDAKVHFRDFDLLKHADSELLEITAMQTELRRVHDILNDPDSDSLTEMQQNIDYRVDEFVELIVNDKPETSMMLSDTETKEETKEMEEREVRIGRVQRERKIKRK